MKRLLVTAMICLSAFSQADTLILEVEVIDGKHQLKREWTVEQTFPMMVREPTKDMLAVHFWQGADQIETVFVRSPDVIRSPLNPDGLEVEHQIMQVQSGIYHIRVPVLSGYTDISITPVQSANDQRTTLKGASTPETLLHIPLQ
ncbi:hypothetical protein [Reinekea blandensis]|uniref:Uncharacterized protein n=1 Tax=Reinekea blandensis MED297 TaxID=314283 RepID=A4BBT7_9GAMM|nr:hypothetical protein [Reinekea blandensis]EAR10422.1 hypothetical protein MED297_01335 [Reinekea sp. MED297] [Reinekea blandensis MED297]